MTKRKGDPLAGVKNGAACAIGSTLIITWPHWFVVCIVVAATTVVGYVVGQGDQARRDE